MIVCLWKCGYFWGKQLAVWGPFGERPLVYLIAPTGVAQITNASPEEAPGADWGRPLIFRRWASIKLSNPRQSVPCDKPQLWGN